METTATQFQDTTAPDCMGVFVTQGDGSTKTVAITRSELQPVQQPVYDGFTSLLSNKAMVTISNTSVGIDANRPIAVAVDMTPVTLDYNNMSQQDKDKVDAFINLLNQL